MLLLNTMDLLNVIGPYGDVNLLYSVTSEAFCHLIEQAYSLGMCVYVVYVNVCTCYLEPDKTYPAFASLKFVVSAMLSYIILFNHAIDIGLSVLNTKAVTVAVVEDSTIH